MNLSLDKQKIVVSSVHPGWVKTDMGGLEADLSSEKAAKQIFDFAITRPRTGASGTLVNRCLGELSQDCLNTPWGVLYFHMRQDNHELIRRLKIVEGQVRGLQDIILKVYQLKQE